MTNVIDKKNPKKCIPRYDILQSVHKVATLLIAASLCLLIVLFNQSVEAVIGQQGFNCSLTVVHMPYNLVGNERSECWNALKHITENL